MVIKKLPGSLYGQGDRIALLKKFLQYLNHPDRNFSIIHVCGTNGKGSTSTMIAALLTGLKYKVGLFTSPFIGNVNEMIRIDQEAINSDILDEYFQIIDQLENQHSFETDQLSQFEKLFLIAMLYFSDQGVDYVVLECGLGGKLDATNAVDKTDYSIFTNISLDHTNILGKTISEIAQTKAKIIRQNAKVVIAPKQDTAAQKVLLKEARLKNARLFLADDLKLTIAKRTKTAEIINLKLHNKLIDFRFSLVGSYQIFNLMTALTWLIDFIKAKPINDFDLKKLLSNTLANLTIPGRFELLSQKPEIICDGAHNPAGIKQFVSTVNCLYPNSKKKVLVAFLKDKDFEKCVAELLNLKSTIFIPTEPDQQERKLSADKLQQVFYQLNGHFYQSFSDPHQALDYALNEKRTDDLILIVGSFYLLKIVRTYLKTRTGKETEKLGN
ncbi:bifunctional folylpolyglutamate synthase/dihydrofolate synthase [Oenococcus sp. UCMA 14587]|nr:bifunctional folylpolyglutamate synthase/dihydrofolate synthase [Oenococcus sp. UCMA 14587]